MKNLLTKVLGIAGITALSFLPMKDVQGQKNNSEKYQFWVKMTDTNDDCLFDYYEISKSNQTRDTIVQKIVLSNDHFNQSYIDRYAYYFNEDKMEHHLGGVYTKLNSLISVRRDFCAYPNKLDQTEVRFIIYSDKKLQDYLIKEKAEYLKPANSFHSVQNLKVDEILFDLENAYTLLGDKKH